MDTKDSKLRPHRADGYQQSQLRTNRVYSPRFELTYGAPYSLFGLMGGMLAVAALVDGVLTAMKRGPFLWAVFWALVMLALSIFIFRYRNAGRVRILSDHLEIVSKSGVEVVAYDSIQELVLEGSFLGTPSFLGLRLGGGGHKRIPLPLLDVGYLLEAIFRGNPKLRDAVQGDKSWSQFLETEQMITTQEELFFGRSRSFLFYLGAAGAVVSTCTLYLIWHTSKDLESVSRLFQFADAFIVQLVVSTFCFCIIVRRMLLARGSLNRVSDEQSYALMKDGSIFKMVLVCGVASFGFQYNNFINPTGVFYLAISPAGLHRLEPVEVKFRSTQNMKAGEQVLYWSENRRFERGTIQAMPGESIESPGMGDQNGRVPAAKAGTVPEGWMAITSADNAGAGAWVPVSRIVGTVTSGVQE